MTTRYSDIISVSSGRAAYNIIDEHSGEWDGFIVNTHFDEILEQCVIPSVRNNNQTVHKPFWINGTYGSGKSHASAVIKHLLCDEVEDIRPFVEREYRDNEAMRSAIFSLREKKRLLPVCLYGLQNMVHEADLSIRLQSAVTDALRKVGLSLNVKTDIQCYLDSVDSMPQVWESLISGDARLQGLAPTLDMLKLKLGKGDTDVIEAMRGSLRDKKLDVRLDTANLADWVFEMQDALRAAAPQYNGFLIVWDEFTDVMRSAVGLNILVVLQEIAEKMANPVNDSYFLLISHPSALDSLGGQEKEKTRGRYHYQKYNMETISAFKIMSRMFGPKDPDSIKEDADEFFLRNDDTIQYYVESVNGKIGSRNDLYSLFPLHPGTANLASCFATLAGSSSRSVFEFLASPAVKAFLDSEDAYARRDVITADILWDFVVAAFKEDYNTFGVVTDKYNSYWQQVEAAGPAVAAAFKGILLLNALLKRDDGNPTVTPSEVNVKHLFAGSRYADQMDSALAYIRDNMIVQRDPNGVYSVQFAAMDPKEVETTTQELARRTFNSTRSIACFADRAKEKFDIFTRSVYRPSKIVFLSATESFSQFQNLVDTEFLHTDSNILRVAVLLSGNDSERQSLKSMAEQAAADPKFASTIFVVCETELGDDNRFRFINYMANHICANRHGLKPNAEVHREYAVKIVDDWMESIRGGLFTWYLNGEKNMASCGKLSSELNRLSGKIFYLGPDALTFNYTTQQWKPTNAKTTVRTIISGNSLVDINKDLGGGPAKIAGLMLQGAVDDSLQLNQNLDSHPLVEAKAFVDKQIAAIKCGEDFNLADILSGLTMPPYGFYKCQAYMGMLAYIMRDYVDKFYDTKGQPHDLIELSEDISEVFETWEKGTRNPKLQFSQESSDARSLSTLMSEVFGLKNAKSLKDARWGLKDYCNKVGFPLWVLCSAPDVKQEEVRVLIKDLAEIQQSEQFTKDSARVASLLQRFELFRFEVSNLLADNGAFRRGFDALVTGLGDVKVEDSDTDSVYNFVKANMEGEAGLWTKEKLKETVLRWRIWKNEDEKHEQERELANLIAATFNLAAVDNLSDLSDGLRRYCQGRGFPLWILEYAPDIVDADVKRLIANLSDLANSPVADPDAIEETRSLMDACGARLSDALDKEGVFRRGFDAYAASIEGSKPEEAAAAYDYVRENSRPEAWAWTPTSVENAILKWRITPCADEDRVLKAVEKVGSLDAGTLRSLLTQICQNGDAAAIDLILKH